MPRLKDASRGLNIDLHKDEDSANVAQRKGDISIALLRARNISMAYPRNKREVLKNINLTFNAGEFVVVRGNSGSGKSTLLAILGGCLTPVNGNVYYMGEDINSLNDKEKSRFHRLRIGYVPQSNVMLKNYTILENIIAPFIYGDKNIDENKIRNRGLDLLDKFNIKELYDRHPSELSGGELKRVSIARAMIMKPDILLLDEPTTGLDKGTAQNILDIIKQYLDDKKLVIVSTHDDNIMDYGTRILEVMQDKGIIDKEI